MRTIYLAWNLHDLHKQVEAANRRNDVAAIRAYKADLNTLSEIVNETLGVGKLIDNDEHGCAQISATQLGLADKLQEKLRQLGRCGLGAGLTILEAKEAAAFSFGKRKGKLVIWSPLLKEKEDLEKTEEVSTSPNALRIIDFEARLHSCALKAIEKEKNERELEHKRLNEARDRAYMSVRALMRQNLLRQMKVEDPKGYRIVSDLMLQLQQLLQEPLSKAWTFKGLPIPHSKKAKGVPVGTILKGKEKVSTPNGDEWKSVRSGKVMSAKPIAEGAKRGYATSNPEG